eukprot:844087-Rhodomonas_salina.1
MGSGGEEGFDPRTERGGGEGHARAPQDYEELRYAPGMLLPYPSSLRCAPGILLPYAPTDHYAVSGTAYGPTTPCPALAYGRVLRNAQY